MRASEKIVYFLTVTLGVSLSYAYKDQLQLWLANNLGIQPPTSFFVSAVLVTVPSFTLGVILVRNIGKSAKEDATVV